MRGSFFNKKLTDDGFIVSLLDEHNIHIKTSSDIRRELMKYHGEITQGVVANYATNVVKKVCRKLHAMNAIAYLMMSILGIAPSIDALVLFDNETYEPIGYILCDKNPKGGKCMYTCHIPYVCATHHKGIPIGTLLLGMVIYQAILNKENGIVLEVAGGKKNNWAAACLYERFGFVYDDEIIGKCVSRVEDMNMYAMRLDLSGYSLELIQSMMTNISIKSITTSDDCEMYYNVRKNKSKIKKYNDPMMYYTEILASRYPNLEKQYEQQLKQVL